MSAAFSEKIVSVYWPVCKSRIGPQAYIAAWGVIPPQETVMRKERSIRDGQVVRKSADPTYICCSLL